MQGSATAISPYRFIPVVGMMAAIFIVSAQPGDQLHVPTFLNYDKAWHMLEYGLLAGTCFFAIRPTLSHKNRIFSSFLIVCFSFLYGLSDEFHQSFVPLRTSSFADVIADTLGATLVAAVWWRRGGSSVAFQSSDSANSSVVPLV